MRYEQRVGRVYRYGQKKVVQIYNLRAKDTVEETVRSYFEQRLKVAAQALQQVTGEKPEDLIASLSWELETEIDPDEIYKRALVDGTLNKQSKEEIQEAVRRAQVRVPAPGQLGVQLIDDRPEPAEQQQRQLEPVGAGPTFWCSSRRVIDRGV